MVQLPSSGLPSGNGTADLRWLRFTNLRCSAQ